MTRALALGEASAVAPFQYLRLIVIAALGWALRLHIATRSLPMADVVAARVLLETDAAQAAAATSGDPESVAVLAEVETLLDRMDDPALHRWEPPPEE